MYKPGERDVILVPLGAYEALTAIRDEEKEFQQGLEAYLKAKQNLSQKSTVERARFKNQAQQKLEKRGISPEDGIQATLSLAQIYEVEKELSEAIAMLAHVLRERPNSTYLYVQLGSLYEQTGDYELALETYKGREKRILKKVSRVAKPKRPVLLLRQAPRGYRNLSPDHSYFLCCGISSSSEANKSYIEGFDEKVEKNDDDLNLAVPSVIRLGFLEWVPIAPLEKPDRASLHKGSISFERHTRLMEKLNRYMQGYFGSFLSD